jgi:hypothetical protein
VISVVDACGNPYASAERLRQNGNLYGKTEPEAIVQPELLVLLILVKHKPRSDGDSLGMDKRRAIRVLLTDPCSVRK